MVVLLTCKNKEDAIKNEGARVFTTLYIIPAPDSLVVRASASRSEGRGFAPRPRHTKGVKMVLVAPLLTLATKG